MAHGSSEVLTQEEKLLIWWKDNNVVTVATDVAEMYSEVPVNKQNIENK